VISSLSDRNSATPRQKVPSGWGCAGPGACAAGAPDDQNTWPAPQSLDHSASRWASQLVSANATTGKRSRSERRCATRFSSHARPRTLWKTHATSRAARALPPPRTGPGCGSTSPHNGMRSTQGSRPTDRKRRRNDRDHRTNRALRSPPHSSRRTHKRALCSNADTHASRRHRGAHGRSLTCTQPDPRTNITLQFGAGAHAMIGQPLSCAGC
jgi:hypothetical protein